MALSVINDCASPLLKAHISSASWLILPIKCNSPLLSIPARHYVFRRNIARGMIAWRRHGMTILSIQAVSAAIYNVPAFKDSHSLLTIQHHDRHAIWIHILDIRLCAISSIRACPLRIVYQDVPVASQETLMKWSASPSIIAHDIFHIQWHLYYRASDINKVKLSLHKCWRDGHRMMPFGGSSRSCNLKCTAYRLDVPIYRRPGNLTLEAMLAHEHLDIISSLNSLYNIKLVAVALISMAGHKSASASR